MRRRRKSPNLPDSMPGSPSIVRHVMPEPGSQLSTVRMIQDQDWVRMPGHLDWRQAVGGVITLGPMTRILWANMTSDMLDAHAPVEILRGREPRGLRGA